VATDQQLLSWLDGRHSDSALTELIKRYGAMVRRTALRITGREHAADDVGQAVFLLAARKASRLAAERRLGGWLYRVTIRTSQDWLKVESRRGNKDADTSGAGDSENESGSRLTQNFDRALGRLSAGAREVIVLRYLCGMNRRDAAASLGITEGALESQASGALSGLHRRLGRERSGLSLSALTAMLNSESAAAGERVTAQQAAGIVSAALGNARTSVDDLASQAARGLAMARLKLVAIAVCGVTICAAIGIAGLLIFREGC
jgi:RNA polymerase sigma factor (sigma-70 family)